ncbi:MAG: glycosyltransferase family 4 protein [Gemmatimonadales bacterium]
MSGATVYIRIAVTALAGALGLTALVRRYALARSVIDVPNERSSHAIPTPRGGGAAIVAVVLAGIAGLTWSGSIPLAIGVALGGGGTMVAAVGWIDDRRGVPSRVRFLIHVLASTWAIAWLGGMPFVTTGADRVYLGLAGSVLAIAAVIWSTNLYNFMDGIDGLAAVEAVTTGLIAATLLAPRSPALAAVSVLVGASAAGFLPWNWSPARIFMGDIGSGFLGFILGGLAAASEITEALPALVWVVILGVFFADATITLVRRMVRGDRWHSAHRDHAYQRAVQSGWPHSRVCLVVVGLNLALGVGVWWAVRNPELLPPVLTTAGLMLGTLYLIIELRRPMPTAEKRVGSGTRT